MIRANDCFLVTFLLLCSFFDLREYRVPNLLMAAAALTGLFLQGRDFGLRLLICLVCAAGIYRFLPVGGADLKAASLTAACIGVLPMLQAVCIGLLLCLLLRTMLILSERRSLKDPVPLIPYLSAGVILWRFLCAGSWLS